MDIPFNLLYTGNDLTSDSQTLVCTCVRCYSDGLGESTWTSAGIVGGGNETGIACCYRSLGPVGSGTSTAGSHFLQYQWAFTRVFEPKCASHFALLLLECTEVVAGSCECQLGAFAILSLIAVAADGTFLGVVAIVLLMFAIPQLSAAANIIVNLFIVYYNCFYFFPVLLHLFQQYFSFIIKRLSPALDVTVIVFENCPGRPVEL